MYNHLDPFDWEDGIDLYQSGKVKSIQDYTGLLSAKVENFGPRAFDTRLKFHPNGKVIQWFECSCIKNRKSGAFCEHLIALMVHIDREIPSLFENLDKKIPIKLPTIRKKASQKLPTEEGLQKASQEKIDRSASNPFMSFVEKGNIASIKQSKSPGKLTISFEIKSGLTDSFDLDIDSSAKLIENSEYKDVYKKSAQNLSFFPHLAFPAIHIQELDDTIVLERVIAIKAPEEVAKKISDSTKVKCGLSMLCELGKEENTTFTTLTFPYKKMEDHFGKDTVFVPGAGYFKYDTSKVAGNWFEMPYQKKLKDNEAGKLIEEGFASLLGSSTVIASKDLKSRTIITPELQTIEVKKHVGSWFFLDPRYGNGEHSISMMELIKEAREKKKKYIQAKGAWFKIPDAISSYDWSLDSDDELLKLDAIGLIRFKASIGEFDSAEGSKEVLSKLNTNLNFNNNIELPSLSKTNLNLRNYQSEGLKWLWWLYSHGLHGLLADDMGLGKTHQSMGLMSAIQTHEKGEPKFLVICPTTVLEHWEDKIVEFAPNLKPIKYHGPKRKMAFDYIKTDRNTLITSYGILLRDIKMLSEIEWNTVILDEAHMIKNSGTSTYKAVCKLNSKMRVCLTGTPIENDLTELKTIYDFMIPGYLGSDAYFKKKFLKPLTRSEQETREEKSEEEKEAAKEIQVQLQKLIHPLKMRRTKQEVLADLPDKIEDLRHCMLSDEQVALYRDTVSLKSSPIIDALENDGAPIPYMHVFATLQLLKQICNHPALVTGRSWKTHESGKFELFKELLNEALGSNHKVVIFTQYVGMINIISDYLNSLEVGHAVLTGATRNRGKLIEEFQTDPKCKVFVGSLLAGGVGIDLTAASVVIHYDRWWNASKESQATDRVHRIGQKRAVQVIKMVTKGTLEEKIDQMINNKKKLFEKYMDKDEELFKKLTKQELIELLSG